MITSKAIRNTVASFACLVLIALLVAPAAEANALYFDLVIDPPTTAFSGIPAVDGFSGTSNRSGPGTWHLYAIDDIDNSFGISSYFVILNPGSGGAIPAISNRSPNTSWFDFNDDGPFGAGFAAVRSGPNSNPIFGAQGPGPSYAPPIGGYGISASDFQLKVTDAESFAGTTNGQWGKYADFSGGSVTLPPSGHVRSPLFLAEGTYTGLPPTVDLTTPASSGGTSMQYFTNANLTSTASATQLAMYSPCPLCGVIVGNENFPNIDANNPGFIERTITGTVILPSGFSPLGPGSWTGFGFDSFVPPGGSGSPFTAQPATFDPATSKFHWNTVGAPLGTYQWHVTATVQGYTGLGFITAHITAVPEPQALTLVGLAVIAGLGYARQRRY
jgi:hypothetical protein